MNLRQEIFTYTAGTRTTNHVGVLNFSRNLETDREEGEEIQYQFVDDLKLIVFIRPKDKFYFDRLSLSLRYDILQLARLSLYEYN